MYPVDLFVSSLIFRRVVNSSGHQYIKKLLFTYAFRQVSIEIDSKILINMIKNIYHHLTTTIYTKINKPR